MFRNTRDSIFYIASSNVRMIIYLQYRKESVHGCKVA